MAHKFEIHKDKKGEFRVRFKYNSETMLASEGYASKSSAMNAIESVRKNAPGATLEDNSCGLRKRLRSLPLRGHSRQTEGVVPLGGLEPTTPSLRMMCSTS